VIYKFCNFFDGGNTQGGDSLLVENTQGRDSLLVENTNNGGKHQQWQNKSFSLSLMVENTQGRDSLLVENTNNGGKHQPWRDHCWWKTPTMAYSCIRR